VRTLRCSVLAVGAVALGIAVPSAQAASVQVQSKLRIRQNVHVSFSAPALADGGYYYAVIVLRPYKRYTRHSPPPCSTSSNMGRTDYGYPQYDGVVALALTPARSTTWHWCPGGSYEGAIYAVPAAPPCESRYPCRAEPYETPCAGVRPGCVEGLVALPGEWKYPDPLPTPLHQGTAIVRRFSVHFPAR
jgi:hypothetical protein